MPQCWALQYSTGANVPMSGVNQLEDDYNDAVVIKEYFEGLVAAAERAELDYQMSGG